MTDEDVHDDEGDLQEVAEIYIGWAQSVLSHDSHAFEINSLSDFSDGTIFLKILSTLSPKFVSKASTATDRFLEIKKFFGLKDLECAFTVSNAIKADASTIMDILWTFIIFFCICPGEGINSDDRCIELGRCILLEWLNLVCPEIEAEDPEDELPKYFKNNENLIRVVERLFSTSLSLPLGSLVKQILCTLLLVEEAFGISHKIINPGELVAGTTPEFALVIYLSLLKEKYMIDQPSPNLSSSTSKFSLASEVIFEQPSKEAIAEEDLRNVEVSRPSNLNEDSGNGSGSKDLTLKDEKELAIASPEPPESRAGSSRLSNYTTESGFHSAHGDLKTAQPENFALSPRTMGGSVVPSVDTLNITTDTCHSFHAMASSTPRTDSTNGISVNGLKNDVKEEWQRFLKGDFGEDFNLDLNLDSILAPEGNQSSHIDEAKSEQPSLGKWEKTNDCPAAGEVKSCPKSLNSSVTEKTMNETDGLIEEALSNASAIDVQAELSKAEASGLQSSSTSSKSISKIPVPLNRSYSFSKSIAKEDSVGEKRTSVDYGSKLNDSKSSLGDLQITVIEKLSNGMNNESNSSVPSDRIEQILGLQSQSVNRTSETKVDTSLESNETKEIDPYDNEDQVKESKEDNYFDNVLQELKIDTSQVPRNNISFISRTGNSNSDLESSLTPKRVSVPLEIASDAPLDTEDPRTLTPPSTHHHFDDLIPGATSEASTNHTTPIHIRGARESPSKDPLMILLDSIADTGKNLKSSYTSDHHKSGLVSEGPLSEQSLLQAVENIERVGFLENELKNVGGEKESLLEQLNESKVSLEHERKKCERLASELQRLEKVNRSFREENLTMEEKIIHLENSLLTAEDQVVQERVKARSQVEEIQQRASSQASAVIDVDEKDATIIGLEHKIEETLFEKQRLQLELEHTRDLMKQKDIRLMEEDFMKETSEVSRLSKSLNSGFPDHAEDKMKEMSVTITNLEHALVESQHRNLMLNLQLDSMNTSTGAAHSPFLQSRDAVNLYHSPLLQSYRAPPISDSPNTRHVCACVHNRSVPQNGFDYQINYPEMNYTVPDRGLGDNHLIDRSMSGSMMPQEIDPYFRITHQPPFVNGVSHPPQKMFEETNSHNRSYEDILKSTASTPRPRTPFDNVASPLKNLETISSPRIEPRDVSQKTLVHNPSEVAQNPMKFVDDILAKYDKNERQCSKCESQKAVQPTTATRSTEEVQKPNLSTGSSALRKADKQFENLDYKQLRHATQNLTNKSTNDHNESLRSNENGYQHPAQNGLQTTKPSSQIKTFDEFLEKKNERGIQKSITESEALRPFLSRTLASAGVFIPNGTSDLDNKPLLASVQEPNNMVGQRYDDDVASERSRFEALYRRQNPESSQDMHQSSFAGAGQSGTQSDAKSTDSANTLDAIAEIGKRLRTNISTVAGALNAQSTPVNGNHLPYVSNIHAQIKESAPHRNGQGSNMFRQPEEEVLERYRKELNLKSVNSPRTAPQPQVDLIHIEQFAKRSQEELIQSFRNFKEDSSIYRSKIRDLDPPVELPPSLQSKPPMNFHQPSGLHHHAANFYSVDRQGGNVDGSVLGERLHGLPNERYTDGNPANLDSQNPATPIPISYGISTPVSTPAMRTSTPTHEKETPMGTAQFTLPCDVSHISVAPISNGGPALNGHHFQNRPSSGAGFSLYSSSQNKSFNSNELNHGFNPNAKLIQPTVQFA